MDRQSLSKNVIFWFRNVIKGRPFLFLLFCELFSRWMCERHVNDVLPVIQSLKMEHFPVTSTKKQKSDWCALNQKNVQFFCLQVAFSLFTCFLQTLSQLEMWNIFHLGICSIQCVILGWSHFQWPLRNRLNYPSPWTFCSIYLSICSAVT